MNIKRCIELCLIFSSIGCVAIQDCEYRVAQRFRAGCAWWQNCEERCSSNPLSHYSKGWRQGYADVLMGGDGTCPPVPPYHYWSFKFQNQYGENAIGDWFLGYQHGGASALASGRSQYHPVPIAGGFGQYSSSCLPSDFAPYELGRSSLGLRNLPPYQGGASTDTEQSDDEPNATDSSGQRQSDSGGPSQKTTSSTDERPATPLPGAPNTESSERTNVQDAVVQPNP